MAERFQHLSPALLAEAVGRLHEVFGNRCYQDGTKPLGHQYINDLVLVLVVTSVEARCFQPGDDALNLLGSHFDIADRIMKLYLHRPFEPFRVQFEEKRIMKTGGEAPGGPSLESRLPRQH